MSSSSKRPALGLIFYFALMFSLGLYFTFASVQGDFGLYRRVQITVSHHPVGHIMTGRQIVHQFPANARHGEYIAGSHTQSGDSTA